MMAVSKVSIYILSALITSALVWVCYLIWSYVPQFIRGTEWNDYRFAISVLAIFAVLTLFHTVAQKFEAHQRSRNKEVSDSK